MRFDLFTWNPSIFGIRKKMQLNDILKFIQNTDITNKINYLL